MQRCDCLGSTRGFQQKNKNWYFKIKKGFTLIRYLIDSEVSFPELIRSHRSNAFDHVDKLTGKHIIQLNRPHLCALTCEMWMWTCENRRVYMHACMLHKFIGKNGQSNQQSQWLSGIEERRNICNANKQTKHTWDTWTPKLRWAPLHCEEKEISEHTYHIHTYINTYKSRQAIHRHT